MAWYPLWPANGPMSVKGPGLVGHVARRERCISCPVLGAEALLSCPARRLREELKGNNIMHVSTLIVLVALGVLLFGGGGGYYWSRRR